MRRRTSASLQELGSAEALTGSTPEGFGVEASVMRQHSGQSVLQHQQTTVRLLLHGEEQPDTSVQRRCGDKDRNVFLLSNNSF